MNDSGFDVVGITRTSLLDDIATNFQLFSNNCHYAQSNYTLIELNGVLKLLSTCDLLVSVIQLINGEQF